MVMNFSLFLFFNYYRKALTFQLFDLIYDCFLIESHSDQPLLHVDHTGQKQQNHYLHELPVHC